MFKEKIQGIKDKAVALIDEIEAAMLTGEAELEADAIEALTAHHDHLVAFVGKLEAKINPPVQDTQPAEDVQPTPEPQDEQAPEATAKE